MKKPTPEEFSKVIYAADVKLVQEMIDAGADIEAPWKLHFYDKRPLAAAAGWSNLTILELLLQAGAEVDAVSPDRTTALCTAASNGKMPDVKIAKRLIEAGADVNFAILSLKGDPVSTVLSTAAYFAIPAFLQLLLDNGAEIDCCHSRGSALMRAASDGRLDNVKLLIDNGADPNVRINSDNKDRDGMSALDYARQHKKKKIVAYLEGLTQETGDAKKSGASSGNAKTKPTKPPSIESSWQKIESSLATQRPDVLKSLGRKATAKQIETAEAKLGVKFPKDFLGSLAVHNGQREPLPLIPSDEGDDLGYSLLPLKEVLSEWKVWKRLLDDDDFSESEASGDEGVRDVWWNPKWIPITTDGGGNHHCLDLSPAKGGKKGQVISLSHEDGTRQRIAISFSHWLAELAKQ